MQIFDWKLLQNIQFYMKPCKCCRPVYLSLLSIPIKNIEEYWQMDSTSPRDFSISFIDVLARLIVVREKYSRRQMETFRQRFLQGSSFSRQWSSQFAIQSIQFIFSLLNAQQQRTTQFTTMFQKLEHFGEAPIPTNVLAVRGRILCF